MPDFLGNSNSMNLGQVSDTLRLQSALIMTMDPKRLVGRVAKLVGLVSKPELNEQAVLIGAYDQDKQRYSAQTFADPNNEIAAASVAVKRANIQLYSDSFDDFYPNAPVVRGYVEPGRQRGTIMDFTSCPWCIVPNENLLLVINESCMVRGAPMNSQGAARPSTVISTTVVINAEGDDIVEFDSIYFNVALRGAVHCQAGKITFRRCFFKSLDSGCTANSSVVFENCVFEDCLGSGVIVSTGAHMTLRNCHIRNCHGGIEVRQGGAANLFHCSIKHCKRIAVVVYAKGLSISLHSCLLESAGDSGVLIKDGGTIQMSNCHVQNCGMAGVAIQGPRSTAVIANTVLNQNRHGLLVQTGKSDVTVNNCQLINNKRFGLFVGQDAIGDIFVTGTSIADNLEKQIYNDGGPKSALYIDGTVQVQDGMMATLASINPVAAQRWGDAVFNGQRPALEEFRARKRAGVGTVRCAACNKEEPPKVKFNKCSRCLEYCYCSKECQVAHWKAHKPDCVKRVKHPQLLDPTKSI